MHKQEESSFGGIRPDSSPDYADIMSVEDVAEYLRMSARSVRLMAQQKKLPGIKFGKSWRFMKSAIDKLFEGIEPSESSDFDHDINSDAQRILRRIYGKD